MKPVWTPEATGKTRWHKQKGEARFQLHHCAKGCPNNIGISGSIAIHEELQKVSIALLKNE